MDSFQSPGISFDVSKDRKFVLKLSQKGLHVHRIDDDINQPPLKNLPFRRPLQNEVGPFKDTIRCSPISYFYAYTNRTQVVTGQYSSERGFTSPVSLPHMSNVNTLDWAYDLPYLLTGSQDDSAVLWDVETQDDLCRFRGGSVDSKINLVAMSKRNYNVFSTCHNRDIKIWDKRKQNSSFTSYAGHNNRITYFDWSPHDDHEFITCSLDKMVKLWSMKNPRHSINEQKFPQQVWRVLYDPLQSRNIFIAIIVPDDRQNEVSPQVIEFGNATPVTTLSSCDSLIIETRVTGLTSGKTTLIGLSKTGKLQMWELEPPASSSLQYISTTVLPDESNAPTYPEMPHIISSSPTSNYISTLELIKIAKYPFVQKMDNQTVVVKSHKSSIKVKIGLSIPESPQFQFEDFPNMSREKEEFLLKDLIDKAKELRAAHCHDLWLEKLVMFIKDEFMEQYFSEDDNPQNSRRSKVETFDHNIPFPRTSGARFCSNNILVVFKRPSLSDTGLTEAKPPKTPKALFDIITPLFSAFQRKRALTPSYPSVSEFLYPLSTRNRQTRGQAESQTNLAGTVQIRDISVILPVCCEKLANEYCLDPDLSLEELCEINIQAASTTGRPNLVQLWRVLKLTTEMKLVKHPSLKKPWAEYPYGRKLIESYINFYYFKKDIQSLAMIYAICAIVDSKVKEHRDTDQDGIFQFLSRGDMLFSSTSLSTSISIADCSDETESNNTPLSSTEDERTLSALDSGINGDYIKLSYANILYNWGFLNKRAEILKTIQQRKSKKADDKQLTFQISRHHYKLSPYSGASSEQITIWNCAICRLPVRSLGSFCLKCLHGGHSHHLQSWFTSIIGGNAVTDCPTGCGCVCINDMGNWDD